MTWREAVIKALNRVAVKYNTQEIKRKILIEEELANIVKETRSKGLTPDQTLNRVLQELRDEGFLEFHPTETGIYLLINYTSAKSQLRVLEQLREELEKPNTSYFIFDTKGNIEIGDTDFEKYSWNLTKFNKVAIGDLFVYRRPKKCI